MTTSVEQQLREHEDLRKRMVAVARRMMESKRQLQQEIRDDMNKPEVRAAIDELKKRNAERTE
ncbi:hypothetical protein ACFSUS_03795 [Spirosoma soli]|uniref:Uncharacterized protein n=1 Tax=Spirosoma soli TaxID=1770529 RepID=A0ABW5M099_9BACT